MKAYKLIFELLKHPFANVLMDSRFKITQVRYNNYYKEYTLDSITNVVNQTFTR